MCARLEYCGDEHEPDGCVAQHSKYRQRSCARNSANLDHQLLHGQKTPSKTHKIAKRKSRSHKDNPNSKKRLRILTKKVHACKCVHTEARALRPISLTWCFLSGNILLVEISFKYPRAIWFLGENN